MTMNSMPGGFWQWTANLSSGERTGLIFFAMIALIAIIAMITSAIYHMHKNRLEDSLKRELLDRGMTADEIATVISNSPKAGSQD
jgi:hypothetical protein